MTRKLLKKRGKKIGAAPGTLIHVGEKSEAAPRIHVFDYDQEHLDQREYPDAASCLALRDTDTISWINVEGLHQVKVIETLGQGFGLHPLVLEDILNTDQRPKVEIYDAYIFIVVKMLLYDTEHEGVRTEQVSFVLGKNFVISFQECHGDVFDGVRERLRSGRRIRFLGSDYLAYALIDAIVDSHFFILEKIGDEIEQLEDELLDDPSPESLNQIHRLRREMILLRKSVWPLRELISELGREETPMVSRETAVFLRDVYDHCIQVIDTVETFRDLLGGMLDLYMSNVSNRMNEIMKVLTLIATIFIPLTFIAGVYGMNFEYMPELAWKWAYPAVWGIMIGLGIGLVFFFKKKNWL